MKMRVGAVFGSLMASVAAVMILTGCGGCTAQQPTQQQDLKGRFQVFPTANGTFLVDTHTGDSWLYANLIWLSTARAQLPPDLHQRALNALFAQPPVGGGTQTPEGAPPANP